MLHLQNAGGKSVGRILGPDRHAGLTQNGAVVERGCHLMHGAPGLGIACGNGAGVGVEAAILWQKRGVDVEHATLPRGGEPCGQDAHEACEAQDVGGGGFEVCLQGRLERGAGGLERSVIYGGGGAGIVLLAGEAPDGDTPDDDTRDGDLGEETALAEIVPLIDGWDEAMPLEIGVYTHNHDHSNGMHPGPCDAYCGCQDHAHAQPDPGFV